MLLRGCFLPVLSFNLPSCIILPLSPATRPIQQAMPGLDPTLRGLNGSTCWTMPAHLKDGPSRVGSWKSTDWPGMAHKPSGLAVPAGDVDGPCRRTDPY